MNKKTIDSLLNLIKTLDLAKQTNKLSNDEKLNNIFKSFNEIPLDIKNTLFKMKNESIECLDFPKDWVTNDDASYIESPSLSNSSQFDDLMIRVSGNFLFEDRQKITNAILYKLKN